MLFGNKNVTKKDTGTYCYCKWGESGAMIECQKCNEWFHDECLGLTEDEILNFDDFYCNACLNKNKNLSITYLVVPPITLKDTYCYCQQGEYGFMAECGKCREWFHQPCTDYTESELDNMLLYFCKECLANNSELKIYFRDYSLENTKPLFTKHRILTVYNLYSYHTLIELYKILKFRTPYCLYELFERSNNTNLLLKIPCLALRCQTHTFTYQSTKFWNKFYKQLVTPFTIKLHSDHTIKHNLLDTECIFYDYSTNVSTFKFRLRSLLYSVQSSGTEVDWSPTNYVSNIFST